MNVNTLSAQVSTLSERLVVLLERASTSAQPVPNLTLIAFKELGVAIEELQIAVEELQRQHDSLTSAIESAAMEQRRYQSLFHFAPQAYLVTDLEGKIQEANWMASQLLEVPEQFLLGKPMMLFIDEADRPAYWAELRKRRQRDHFQEWDLRIHPRNNNVINVACSIVSTRDQQGEPIGFRWAFRDITARKRLENLQHSHHQLEDEAILLQHYPVHHYAKGDLIPLQSDALWCVTQGLVKLTTLTEQGKEVLLAFAGPGIPFGTFLTSRPLYQATAQSEVYLVSISLSEVTDSSRLCQLMFVKTAQRLRQSETLLTILGERSIEERLYQLLCLLKEEIGKPVDQGVRLEIRFTHEDLAEACGSTRVTITRSLGKLQREGKLILDDKHHIILLDE